MTCSLCGDVCRCVPDDIAQSTCESYLESEVEHAFRRCHGSEIFAEPSDRTQDRERVGQLDENLRSRRPKFVLDAVERDDAPLGSPERQEALHESDVDCIVDSSRSPFRQEMLPTETVDTSWRDEVTARLHRYQARRRPRAPRYPSLRLKFESPELSSASASHTAEVLPCSAAQNSFASVTASRESVAVDCAATEAVATAPPEQVVEATPRPAVVHRPEHVAKIIAFPRPVYEPPVITNELAEPIFDRPRILEAPEVVPPPPALGGITIEVVAKAEPERRPGIDMPLHPAPLEQRFAAMMIDGVVVAIAVATFSAIYYQLTKAQPPIMQIFAVGGGLLGFFWAAYQYLLVVYSGTTPGLRAMKLQLLRFDGHRARRPLRKWRVLASWLSAVSLGMGYLWQFLDEDGLCWHERVTKTYLASGRKPHVLLQNPPVRE